MIPQEEIETTLRRAYTKLWGKKVFWLAGITLVPLAIRSRSFGLVVSPATIIYVIYHCLGAYLWLQVNSVLDEGLYTKEQRVEPLQKLVRPSRVHGGVGAIVLVLVLLTIIFKVDFFVKGSKLPCPEWVSIGLGLDRDYEAEHTHVGLVGQLAEQNVSFLSLDEENFQNQLSGLGGFADKAYIAGSTYMMAASSTPGNDAGRLIGQIAPETLIFSEGMGDDIPSLSLLSSVSSLRHLYVFFEVGDDDLNGLLASKKLVTVFVDRCGVSKSKRSFEVTALKMALRLEVLILDDCQVSDLAPLNDLRQLKLLSLSGSKIESLEGIAGLTSLEKLYLGRTPLADLSGLERLTSLKHLDLSRTAVANISAVAGMRSLTYLNLGGSFSDEILDLTPLKRLTALEFLDLDRRVLSSDLSALADLTSLKDLSLSGGIVEDGELEILDLSALKGLHLLETLDLSDRPLADLSPLRNLASLEELAIRDVGNVGTLNLSGLAGLKPNLTIDLRGTRQWTVAQLKELHGVGRISLRRTQVIDDRAAEQVKAELPNLRFF